MYVFTSTWIVVMTVFARIIIRTFSVPTMSPRHLIGIKIYLHIFYASLLYLINEYEYKTNSVGIKLKKKHLRLISSEIPKWEYFFPECFFELAAIQPMFDVAIWQFSLWLEKNQEFFKNMIKYVLSTPNSMVFVSRTEIYAIYVGIWLYAPFGKMVYK